MSKRTYLIILAIGAFLRLFLIGNAGLWYDENFSLILSRAPFLNMFMATVGDVHPPLYYILIWPIGQIANMPPWAIRVPSALFSIVTLALFPRILKSLSVPKNVKLIAFVMLAILPMQIHYAQEGRMYALLEMLMVIGVLAVLEDRPVLLAGAAAALLYTQNYGLFYVAALGCLVLILFINEWRSATNVTRLAKWFAGDLTEEGKRIEHDIKRRWLMHLLALAIGGILWLPWLPIMLQQAAFIHVNYWIFDLSWGAMLYEIWKLFWAFSLTHPSSMIAAMLVTYAWLLLGIWYLFVKRPATWPTIALLAFGPVVMAIVASFTVQPILLFRPLIGITPFLYLVCAYPLGALNTARARLYVACFIAPLILMSLIGYYYYLPGQKMMDGTGNMQSGIDYITAHWQPGDMIFDTNDLGWINVRPYTDLPEFSNPNCEERFPGAISPATHEALGVQNRTLDQLPPHKRLWVVAIISPMLRDCELARTHELIGDAKPAFIMQDNKLLLSAIWLMEDK